MFFVVIVVVIDAVSSGGGWLLERGLGKGTSSLVIRHFSDKPTSEFQWNAHTESCYPVHYREGQTDDEDNIVKLRS